MKIWFPVWLSVVPKLLILREKFSPGLGFEPGVSALHADMVPLVLPKPGSMICLGGPSSPMFRAGDPDLNPDEG